MHAALIAIAGSALTLGVVSATNPGAPIPAQAATAAALASPGEPAGISNELPETQYAFAGSEPFEMSGDATLTTLFRAIREASERPLVIHWNHLEDIGIAKNASLAMDADPLPLSEAFRIAVLKTTVPDFGHIAVYETYNAIEITTSDELDRRTVEVRTYDIADLLRNRTRPDAREIGFDRSSDSFSEAAQYITDPLMEMVARETWVDFGGDLGTVNLIGGSLVIKTSVRYHDQVEAFLEVVRREDARLMANADERLEEVRRLQAERDDRRRQAHLEQVRLAEEQDRRIRDEAEQVKRDEIAHLEAELERVTAELAEYNAEQSVNMSPFMVTQQDMTDDERKESAREHFVRRSRISDLTVMRESIRDQLIFLKYGVQPSDGTTLEAIQQQLKDQADRLKAISNSVNR